MNSAEISARLSAGVSSQYAIEREIGAGGMATVYLARDLRHDRRVAFKVLNPELGAVLGVDRFLSEIRVTANLQHPNLLPLFDSGETDGLLYYVMPYVDGESLRARLDRERQLSVDEAIRIAVLVAGALDYAHGEGVIHRDLKPENILLSRGQPLIADFGIALAVSLAGGARVTQTGLSLGTPQYMSPEQATGDRQIDARTDVYSLAAVLYEMLTGDPPHNANTVQGIIAKVLTERPTSVRVGRPNVSEQVDYAILHALEKLPADRISSAREFAQALEGKSLVLPAAYATMTRRATTAQIIVPSWADRLREPLTLALVAATVVCGAIAIWKWNGDASADEDPTVRFILQIPEGMGTTANGAMLAVSPDGRNFVYRTFGTSDTLLYLRPSGSLHAIPIPGSGGGLRPVFSPDGKWIAYQARGELKKVSLDGFRTLKVADLPVGLLGAWLKDDKLLLFSMPGLSTLSASGGVPVELTVPDTARSESSHGLPRVAPDGETVFFGVAERQTRAPGIGAVSLKTRKRTFLAIAGSPLGVIDDYLIYSTEAGSLFAVSIDIASGDVRGNSVLVADSMRMQGGRGAAVPNVNAALSQSGTLIYLSGASTRPRDVVTIDTSGAKRVLISAAAPGLSDPRLSPNGRRIAFSAATDTSSEVWVYDLVSRTMDRLARERDGRSFRPEWTPDGKRILFNRTVNAKEELWWQLADGSAPAELLQSAPTDIPQGFVSPNSEWLIYRLGSPGARAGRARNEASAQRGGRAGSGGADTDLWYRRLSGDTTSKSLSTASGYVELAPALSPDSRWLAYSSNETGVGQVYVRPFPGPGARKLVSIDGGAEAMWSRDGKTLFYRNRLEMIAATIVTTPEFTVTNRRRLFSEAPVGSGTNHRQYDLSPDGKSFLMISVAADELPTVVVVHNWAAELRARLSGARSGDRQTSGR